MVSLPTLLSIYDAAQKYGKYGLDETCLRTLVETGKIRAGVIEGKMFVSEDEVREQAIEAGLRKEDLPEWKKHEHLHGSEIGVGEGSRKYDIPVSTLYRWALKKIVRIIRREGQKVLLDEADVAYCAEIYHRRRGQGKWVFDEKGLPYKPKKRLAL